MSDIESVIKALDKIESKLVEKSDRADNEIKELGKVTNETKNALEAIGVSQREFADRLLSIEQKKTATEEEKVDHSWGSQLVKSANYGSFASGQ